MSGDRTPREPFLLILKFVLFYVVKLSSVEYREIFPEQSYLFVMFFIFAYGIAFSGQMPDFMLSPSLFFFLSPFFTLSLVFSLSSL